MRTHLGLTRSSHWISLSLSAVVALFCFVSQKMIGKCSQVSYKAKLDTTSGSLQILPCGYSSFTYVHVIAQQGKNMGQCLWGYRGALLCLPQGSSCCYLSFWSSTREEVYPVGSQPLTATRHTCIIWNRASSFLTSGKKKSMKLYLLLNRQCWLSTRKLIWQ